jgi:hypothetical protein
MTCAWPGCMHRKPIHAVCVLGLFASCLVAPLARAEAPCIQSQRRENEGFSLGMDVQRMQDDFGVGLRAATPFFFDGTTRITVGGGVDWFPHGVSDSGHNEWITYGHARLVIEGGRRIEGAPIRLYGFGGVQLLFLPDRLSSTSVAVGGLGGFGFEFYMRRGAADGPVSYFIEIGGVGMNATANQQPGHPGLATGFLTTAGMRWYL